MDRGRRAIAACAIGLNFGNFMATALRAIARDVDSSSRYFKELIPAPCAKKIHTEKGHGVSEFLSSFRKRGMRDKKDFAVANYGA